MNSKHGLACILLLALTGCGLRQGVSSCVPSFPMLTDEERARIHDISFPLGVQPEKISFTERQLVLSYTTELAQERLSSLYRTGMEYWGWDELSSVRAAESCLSFSKPSKLCTITLRPEGVQTRVVIFSTVKKGR